MQRRELFSKIFKPIRAQNLAPKPILPPYFSGKLDCANCSAPCVSACERGLIKFENDMAKFSPNSRGCNFCTKCAEICQKQGHKTLNLASPARINAKVFIDTANCLAWSDIICYNCQEACKFGAIEYFSTFRPIINNRCTSCAQCVSACFKNSIKMEAI